MQEPFTSNHLIQNLKDAGFEQAAIEQFLSCWTAGNVREPLRILAKQRANLLDHIHQQEKQIGCLDYLVYQIHKKTDTPSFK